MVREWNFLLKSDLARCLEVGLPLLNGKAWERLSTTIFAHLPALKGGQIPKSLKSPTCSQKLLRKERINKDSGDKASVRNKASQTNP